MPKNTRAYRNTLAEFMSFLMGNAAEGDGGGGVAGLVATKDFLYSLGRVSKGIGGRKAARVFTREERGWVFTYTIEGRLFGTLWGISFVLV